MLKETPLPTTVRPPALFKLSGRLRQFMAENHFRDGDKLPPGGLWRNPLAFPEQRPWGHSCPRRTGAP